MIGIVEIRNIDGVHVFMAGSLVKSTKNGVPPKPKPPTPPRPPANSNIPYLEKIAA